MVQACTFAYQCTRLSSQIRKALTGNSDLVLATYSSILQQMDEMGNSWGSSFDSVQPSIPSIGVHAYQGNFQMHLSTSILTFLRRASQAGFSHQQHINSTAMQERCIAAFRATATRILHAQGMSQDMGHLEIPNRSDSLNFGWADAVMIYGSLRTIAMSPNSLGWHRNAANGVCVILKERLGFQLLL